MINLNDKESKKLVDLTTKRLHTDYFIICLDNGYGDEKLLKLIMKGNAKVVILIHDRCYP